MAAATEAQNFTVTNAGGRVACGKDFFQNDTNELIDYSSTADLSKNGIDDTGLSGAVVSGGQYSFTTASAPQIFLWFPGVGDPSGLTAYAEPRTGSSIPIDASTYKILSMKISCPSCPLPELVAGGCTQANFIWYNGPAVTPLSSTTGSFCLRGGDNIYQYNLSTMTTVSVPAPPVDGNWTGTRKGLRLTPANASGVAMSIDWVMLTQQSSATTSINWTLPTVAKIQVRTDNAGVPGTLLRFMRTQATANLADYQPQDLVNVASYSAGTTTIDTSMLAPGTYWLRATDASGTQIPGTTDQRIIVNHFPRVSITQPDDKGDESREYTLLYRKDPPGGPGVTPDTWDFSQTSDYSQPFVDSPTESGSTRLVSDFTTPTLGTFLSGTWMEYTSAGATKPTGSPGADPNFLLTLKQPVVSLGTHHNLIVRMMLDRPRDIGLGSVMRVHWSADNPVFDLSRLNTSQDIIVENGINEFRIDLEKIQLDPASTGSTTWPGTVFVPYLRIDPHEFPLSAGVTNAYFDSVSLTPTDRTTNGQFLVSWSSSDPDVADLSRTVAIRLDADTNPANGFVYTLATGLADGASGGTYTLNANSSGVAQGTYNVVVEVSDGRNTTIRYSTGALDVFPLPAAANVPMYRAYNPNAFYHFFTTSLGEFNNAVAAGYNNESTPSAPFQVPNTNLASTQPIYRMYNPNSGRHYYTASTGERDFLMAIGWIFDKVEGYIYPSLAAGGSAEIYKLYNNISGVHLYTAKAGEKDAILAQFPGIWFQHTSLGFAFP